MVESETWLSFRMALTGASASNRATANLVFAIHQISNHVAATGPSCNKNVIAFAQASGATVGLYVGSQVHRQDIAAKLLSQVLALVEAGRVSESLVAELCDPEAEYGADYVAGLVIDTEGDVEKVRQSVQQWSMNSCLTSRVSGQVFGEAVTFSIPAPSSSLLAGGPGGPTGNSTSASRNGTTLTARRHLARNGRAVLQGLEARQSYCSNVKTVVGKLRSCRLCRLRGSPGLH